MYKQSDHEDVKVSDPSRGWAKGSLFNCYYTEV